MEDEDDVQSQSLSLSRSPSPPPHPISVVPPSAASAAPNGRLSSPAVTVAAPPHQTLTLALPIQHPRLPSSSNPSGGGGGGREDCWSEGATSNLIDAWGERYLELSRGNLKQKHWQEVADAVSSRDDYTKPPKTDVQCKNRIDTLKKKYKLEKSKIASGATSSSSWPFFHRLDLLIGPNQKSANPNNPNNNPPPPSKGPTFNPIRPQFPQKLRTSHPSSKKRSRSRSPSSASSKSEEAASADSSDSFPPETAANGRKRVEPAAGVKELTRAIIRFGEVYERVESSKLQQAMEMEKQRMGFARELELQRMQFFMKTQMELSQLKRHHQGSGRRRRRRSAAADGGGGSSNNHHHHHHREDINSNNSNNTE